MEKQRGGKRYLLQKRNLMKRICLLIILLMAGCTPAQSQDEMTGDIIDAENYVSENKTEDLREEQSESRPEDMQNIQSGDSLNDQMEEREIVCENPYFFPQDVSIWTTDITCGDFHQTYEGELELHWLKQYDDGCLARLSVAPFDYGDEEDKYYLGISYFEMYFYVTSDEIYRIDFFVSSAEGNLENRDAYIDYNDRLLMTVLNTDERLVEYGNLVCSPENVLNEVEEGEYGTYLSIRQEGNQVLYGQSDVTPYNIIDWEDYCWEYGRGLVEYRKGRRAENNPFYLKNIAAK